MDLTLVSLAIRCLARRTVNDVNALILALSRDQYEGLMDLVDKVTEKIRETVSREVAQQFASCCSHLSHNAGFLISMSLSSVLDEVATDFVHERLVASFPNNVLSQAASRFPDGLTSLNLPGAYVEDDFLVTLSTSGAAKTLRKFVARRGSISDTSSHAWALFPVLEEVDIKYMFHFREKTLLAISRLPELRVLNAYSFNPFNPELLPVMLAPDSMPKLSILDVHMRFDDSGRELDILLDVLEKRSDRHLIESIRINPSWQMDDRVKRLHRMCPNLTSFHAEGDSCKLSAEVDAEFLSCVSNIRRLDVSACFASPTADLVASTLPSLFPALETLVYSNAQPIDDFSRFTDLRELNYFTERPVNIRLLPKTLEQLIVGFGSLEVVEETIPPSHEDRKAMESLISVIVDQIPKVKILRLQTSQNEMITEKDAEFLLKNLVDLSILRLKCGDWEYHYTRPSRWVHR